MFDKSQSIEIGQVLRIVEIKSLTRDLCKFVKDQSMLNMTLVIDEARI